MGSLSEVAGGRGMGLFGLVVSFPGSYTLRDALAPYTSATGGHFRGLVKSWSPFRYAVSERGGRLPSVEATVRINDHGRTLLALKDGVYADTLRGSAASVYWMAPGTASSSWDPLFVGIVTRISFPEPFVAELSLRVDDRRLKRTQSDAWKLTRQSFPNAKADIFGKWAPCLYGSWDASNVQVGPGLVPTLYCDTVRFRYLVCAGKAKSIIRAYADGVEVAGWTTQYITVNGRMYTVIEFSADQGDAVITCDAEGYATTYSGATLMTNPASQFAHRMTHFVLGDWDGGSAYSSTSSLIDSTTLASTVDYLDDLGVTGRDYDADGSSGDDVIAKFMTSFRLECGWTYSGTIAIGWEDLAADIYTGQRYRWYRDEMGPFSIADEDFATVSRITVQSNRSVSQNAYLDSLTVVDASVSSDTPGTLDLALVAD